MTSHELNQLERLNEYLLVMVIPNVRKKIREASLLQDGSEQRKQKIAEIQAENTKNGDLKNALKTFFEAIL